MFRKLKGLVWIQIRRIILKAFPELRILQNEGRRIIADVEHQTLLGKNNKFSVFIISHRNKPVYELVVIFTGINRNRLLFILLKNPGESSALDLNLKLMIFYFCFAYIFPFQTFPIHVLSGLLSF